MHYDKMKKQQRGICKICGHDTDLSWDHVPPQGGIELQTVEIEAIFQVLDRNKQRRFVTSQNGVKYRTICKPCNSLLGRKYDPVLNDFSIGVGRFLKANLHLPDRVMYQTKPMSLIRGLLGHLLATQLDANDGYFDQAVRPLVFDEGLPIPDDIYIFYWIYPYDRTIIVRDILKASIRVKADPLIFCAIKYFPIAYLITRNNEINDLEELTAFRHLGVDDEVQIPINLGMLKAYDWPERVDDEHIILTNKDNSSITARPKPKKKAK